MKVKCINVGGYSKITQDKIYEVVRESELRYKIINDRSDESTYRKSYFEIVEEDNNMNTLIKNMEEEYVENFEVLGTCCICGRVVIDTQDFTITDGEYIMHDECK